MNIDEEQKYIAEYDNLTDTQVLHIYRNMLLIRIFEQRVAGFAASNEVTCPVHLYVGQEAIAAGVCENLDSNDYAFSTHRSHGHYLAKGGDVNALMAEIFLKSGGCSNGKGGSMHVIDPEIGFMGSSAIVAGTIPIAVGAGLTAKVRGRSQISVAFFGDGATDEGVFYESLNYAALHKLPVLFVCENNSFSTHMPAFLRQSNPEVCERVAGFKIKTARVDGNLPLDVCCAAADLIGSIRSGNGPALLECMTYRWLAHVGPTPDIDIGYRVKKDIDFWMAKCPIVWIKKYLSGERKIYKGEIDAAEAGVQRLVEQSIEYAKASPEPAADSLTAGQR